jgi:hypothetical protein
VKDDVEAFLVDREMERTRRYVDEGRRFKSVADDNLRGRACCWHFCDMASY